MSVLPHYDVYDGTGPYLLLVHGMLSSRAQWMANVEALSKLVRPVVLELWGHARSPAPKDPALYHPDAYIAIFEKIRTSLAVERWYVCGQSFGAGLTLRYALTYPEHVIAQVFTNSNSALADGATLQRYRDNAAARSRLIEEEGLAGLEKLPIHPVHGKRLPPEVHQALLADAALHTPEAFALTFTHTSPYLSVRDQIVDNQVPTLLVCGERERRFAPVRDFVEASVPNAQVFGINAGHGVNIQAADKFNQVVSDFLATHQSQGSAQ